MFCDARRRPRGPLCGRTRLRKLSAGAAGRGMEGHVITGIRWRRRHAAAPRPCRRRLPALLVVLAASGAAVSGPAGAEGLGDRLRQGMSKVGEGAQAVGQGAARVGERIDESIRSTEKLLRDGDSPEAKRAELDAMALEALGRLFEEQPDALDLFLLSYGYAVFDTRKLVVVGLAAGGGRGVAVSRDGGRHVYMNMGTAGVGLSLGLGGFETQQVILFESDWHFSDFLRNGVDATAEAGAMAGSDRTEFGVRFVDGRAVYLLTTEGWKVSATAMGTRYWVDGDLNAGPSSRPYPGGR